MTIQNFQRARHSLVPSVYLRPTMVGPGEKLPKMKALRWLENAILRLVFATYTKYFLQLYVLSIVVEALCSLQLFKNYLILTMQ